ncbi:DUF1707 domain-containing protein [Phytoactinopolyspora halotolerans]|uniref:DUF1707 domain-containing protein n=1 Tax=Phytoactinopolyspora halotolerans TaxID=1981512 RepID=A0A6L9S6Z9_9ACTN|nr:DUF1707 domain-containing protein [Phytoactinopolyspora halotolerans]NEE00753.1 DUF1707 domain-containing protein [Phytoactinopolyspora halotolerans]
MSAAGAVGPPYHPQTRPPQLRCSDSEREAVAAMVRSASEDGRLDLTELDERLGAVYAAKTHGDLAQIIVDIVPPPMRPMPPRPSAMPQPVPVVPVMPVMPVQWRPGVSDRTILPAFLLCIFLGVFGAHRFYVGKVGSGIGMLVACLLSFGVVAGIWALIDLIVLATRSFRDQYGNILRNWT